MSRIEEWQPFHRELVFPPLKDLLSPRDTIQVLSDTSAVELEIHREGAHRPWFVYKLRDRSQDGPGWQPSELTTWPYSHEDDVSLLKAVEESTYWMHPEHSLELAYYDADARFIDNPFEALPKAPTRESLGAWIHAFNALFDQTDLVFPGYFSSQRISGVRTYIVESIYPLLASLGYEAITAVPTWYHVAKKYERLGFEYVHRRDIDDMNNLSNIVEALPLTSAQKSWLVMRQFWAQLCEEHGFDPDELLQSPWPLIRDQDHRLLLFPLSEERNLWMQKRLT